MTTLKECFKCLESKPLSEFYKHPQMADGHLGKCKDCTKKDVKQSYLDNIDARKAYEQERSKSKERVEKVLGYQINRRLRSPEKFVARSAVSNALRDGRITRKPCESCGDPDTQAHHPDYSKPLEVNWLCFQCHRKLHGQFVYLAEPTLA